jgi:hypothetical protein
MRAPQLSMIHAISGTASRQLTGVITPPALATAITSSK